jgi:uncharacterized damage-inducible protein DinB
MKVTEILTLMEHNYWAMGRLLDAASRLTPEQFTAPQAPHVDAPRDILAHTLSAERLWRTRWQTGVSSPPFRADEVPTVAALQDLWREEERATLAYLTTLKDEALGDPVQFRRGSGELSDPLLRWHMVIQLVTHGTQHRSEVAMQLTAYGCSPGDLDFLLFVLPRR